MRTIDKGRNEKIVSDYKQFRDDLVERIGCYCSYCEMKIDNQPDVEHVVSKSITDMASSTGFPSLWANIFQNYPKIVKAIYESFSGTDMKCFDSQMKPLRGIKGKI